MMHVFREKLGRILGRKPASLQVAALCLDPKTNQVLLITSRGTGRWITPKGWPMEGRTLGEAAAQEAWEEAGVRGALHEEPLGAYHYDKQQDRGFAVPVDVRVFRIDVTELAKNFPERDQRERRWFPPAEAATLVAESGLQKILLQLASAPVR